MKRKQPSKGAPGRPKRTRRPPVQYSPSQSPTRPDNGTVEEPDDPVEETPPPVPIEKVKPPPTNEPIKEYDTDEDGDDDIRLALIKQQETLSAILEHIKASTPSSQVNPSLKEGQVISDATIDAANGKEDLVVTPPTNLNNDKAGNTLAGDPTTKSQNSKPVPIDPLVASIPANLKREIWAGGFFDLSKLMKFNEVSKRITMDLSNGQPTFHFNQHVSRRYSLSQWRDAFLKYATCLSIQQPTQSAGIFSYMHFIEEMAVDFHDTNAWFLYDIEFRQLKALSQDPWTKFQEQPYMKAVAKGMASLQNQPSHSRHPHQNDRQTSEAGAAHRKEVPNGYCRRFATSGCPNQDNNCRWLHRCFKCQARHPSQHCQDIKDGHSEIKKPSPKPNINQ